MSVQIRLVHDHITPHLEKIAEGIQDRRPILQAMGAEVVSLTKRAFNNPSLRPAPRPR